MLLFAGGELDILGDLDPHRRDNRQPKQNGVFSKRTSRDPNQLSSAPDFVVPDTWSQSLNSRSGAPQSEGLYGPFQPTIPLQHTTVSKKPRADPGRVVVHDAPKDVGVWSATNASYLMGSSIHCRKRQQHCAPPQVSKGPNDPGRQKRQRFAFGVKHCWMIPLLPPTALPRFQPAPTPPGRDNSPAPLYAPYRVAHSGAPTTSGAVAALVLSGARVRVSGRRVVLRHIFCEGGGIPLNSGHARDIPILIQMLASPCWCYIF